MSSLKLVGLAGIPGAEKDAATKYLKGLNFHEIPTVTTRARRPGDGSSYIYKGLELFMDMRIRKMFLWAEKIGDAWYGVRRDDVRRALYDRDIKRSFVILNPKFFEALFKQAIIFDLSPHDIRLIYIKLPSKDVPSKRIMSALRQYNEQEKLEYEGWEEKSSKNELPIFTLETLEHSSTDEELFLQIDEVLR